MIDDCPKPPCVDKAAKADSARVQFDSAYSATPSPDREHLQKALRLQGEAGPMEMLKAGGRDASRLLEQLKSLVMRRSTQNGQ